MNDTRVNSRKMQKHSLCKLSNLALELRHQMLRLTQSVAINWNFFYFHCNSLLQSLVAAESRLCELAFRQFGQKYLAVLVSESPTSPSSGNNRNRRISTGPGMPTIHDEEAEQEEARNDFSVPFQADSEAES